MSVITTRLINAAWGRPSVAKAVLWSLSIHVGAMAASYCGWLRPVESASLAGTRNVVQVEAVFAGESPQRVVELTMPVEPEEAPIRPLADDNPRPPLSMANPLHTETLDISKHRVAIPIARHARPHEETHVADESQFVAWMDVERPPDIQRASQPPAIEAPSKILRRETSVSMPATSVAAEQVAGVDDRSPPDFLGNLPPEYPAFAIARRLEGTVLLRLHIAATGRVERVEIVTSSGHGILDHAAVEAVSRWQGRPAQQAGTPCATIELLPVRFRL